MIFIHDVYKFIPTYRLTLSGYPTRETINQILEWPNYGTRDFAILAVLFKAHKIVYTCACLVPHPFWPDQLKIASAWPGV